MRRFCKSYFDFLQNFGNCLDFCDFLRCISHNLTKKLLFLTEKEKETVLSVDRTALLVDKNRLNRSPDPLQADLRLTKQKPEP